jgi:hypothetical protein
MSPQQLGLYPFAIGTQQTGLHQFATEQEEQLYD